ncbi:MAG TPA: hypothetical protein VL688_05405 [Verrucomicrobiae bacterium]|jgi:hypothetical protein|nr:hypothetical protein [Verrucomicrobiae bacterium]
MSHESDFNQDMKKFIQMLKKILNNSPFLEKSKDFKEAADTTEFNVNFYIFPLISMSPEEMDELEEIYENFLMDDDRNAEDLTPDLTKSDLDFLRRHGIRF